MGPLLVTKTEFAEELGVGRSAVSNWIERGIITSDAIVGEGRRAKVNLEIAREQVRRNRDIGQSLGNGIETRTSTNAARAADLPAKVAPNKNHPDLLGTGGAVAAAEPAKPIVDTVEDQLKRAKLEQQLRTNRIQASEEAARQGLLVAADDAREQMARVASMMLQIFEGSLPDLGAAISAQFDIPQRDVLHLLRAEFKKVRTTAAMKEKARAGAVSREKSAAIELE